MPHRWDQSADVRRRQIETGIDLTFCKVFLPYYTDLISEASPLSLLEVGCGTGHLSLELSKFVRNIIALEPSQGMFAIAQEVLRSTSVRVLNCPIQQYTVNNTFDMIVSHMCLQVIEPLEELLSSVVCHMGKSSSFIFSIPHPCFYNDYKKFFSRKEFYYMEFLSKDISFSITKEPETEISGVPYHHRPLSGYFSVLKSAGLVITDFCEIFPSYDVQALYGLRWNIPRYCVFQARRGCNGVLKV